MDGRVGALVHVRPSLICISPENARLRITKEMGDTYSGVDQLRNLEHILRWLMERRGLDPKNRKQSEKGVLMSPRGHLTQHGQMHRPSAGASALLWPCMLKSKCSCRLL